jgi:hypothetical protein
LFGSQSPQFPPKRGTPPDEPQPRIVKKKVDITQLAFGFWLLKIFFQSFSLVALQNLHMII